ncbi:hypothetical protein LOY70_23050 [Pseudomonas sp. B21-054]|uniref:hypothetical protein n=1 Tax=Pseudomonas sp. B21-054 TaxID=2895494 RepID=UPI002230DFC3|nr:hypothetical protein [Pseudomonas sp. B21-054]UZE16735.1 hypothetical protein LOY70_23050 [Pseudomonas sp. B21-054]
MDIQSSTLDDLFVLYSVIIPGWIAPVKPVDLADGGIPKSLYDGQPQGLLCVIDPWTELKRQSWIMAAYDRADLYVNDDPTPVAGKTVDPGEEDDRIPLRIPHGHLIHGVNRLHYKVTRPGENAAPSRDSHVLYHLRAPGEPAPDGLDLLIPSDVVSNGVSAERAAQGVEFGFAYTNPRNYDRINFLVGNVTIPFEVADASIPVTRTLFTATFQQAGDNPNTLIEYRVTDQLGNSNQSPTKRLDIHLDRQLDLPPPRVKEALGNNLDPVDAKDTLTVVVRYDDMLPTDLLSVTWAGTAGAGSHTTGAEEVGTVGDREVPIPVAVLAFNLGKTVTVSYTVTRNNRATTTPSDPLLLSVRDIAQSDLPTPLIREAANGGTGPELDLASFAGDANVTVTPWPLIAIDQKVWLYCEGTKTDGTRHTITLQTATSLTADEVRIGLSKPVPRGQLQLLRDRSDLSVVLQVTFNKAPDITEAISFPLRTYSIRSVVLETPLITSVKDPGGTPISDNGYTLATTVKLTGEATPDTKVEIFDEDEYKSTLEVDGKGLWEGNLSGLDLGEHSLTARGIYRNNPVSPPWGFTVVEPLTIDTSTATLSTRMYRTAKFPARPPVGAYVERIPSGGVPPYIYTSSDPNVAELFSSTQPRVVSKFSGAATITVRDQFGGHVQYPVTTSGVWLLMGMGNDYTWHTYWNCWSAALSFGGVIPDLQTWGALRTIHDGDPGLTNLRSWTSTPAPDYRRQYSIDPLTGDTESLSQDSDFATGWMIKEI